MRKHILIVSIAILLIAVGLSGCEEVPPCNTDIEIISYDVESWGGGWNGEKIADGFVYTDDMKIYGANYKVSGVVRNNAKRLIEKITITAKFYDVNGTFLYEEATWIEKIPSYSENDFEIKVSNYETQHFKDIECISLYATIGNPA